MIYRKINYQHCRSCGNVETRIIPAEQMVDKRAVWCYCENDKIGIHSTEIITPDKPIKVNNQLGGLL